VNEIPGIISRLERQRTALERAISALRDMEGAQATAKTGTAGTPARGRKKSRLSAAGRRRIAEAARKRWAEKRAADAAAAKKKTAR
jgi:hypothetical protein